MPTTIHINPAIFSGHRSEPSEYQLCQRYLKSYDAASANPGQQVMHLNCLNLVEAQDNALPTSGAGTTFAMIILALCVAAMLAFIFSSILEFGGMK